MFKKHLPNKLDVHAILGIIPHCEGRVLHAPGECSVCDAYPQWQALRQLWGIAFTGYTPEGTQLPCPADHARGEDHKIWPGNRVQTVDLKKGEDGPN